MERGQTSTEELEVADPTEVAPCTDHTVQSLFEAWGWNARNTDDLAEEEVVEPRLTTSTMLKTHWSEMYATMAEMLLFAA